MKAFTAILLFICAAGADRNWVRLPDAADLNELGNLLRDTKSVANPSSLGSKAALGNLAKLSANYRAKQNNHHGDDEGSGVNPSEGRENSIDDLLKGIRIIMPALKKMRGERDHQSHEYAEQFATALKDEPDDNKVKALFGRHIRMLHESCNEKLVKLARAVHQSDFLKQFEHDSVDLVGIMGMVIHKAQQGASFIEEFFKAFGRHDVKEHPGVKVITAIGGLLADAACHLELDGFLDIVGKAIEKHEEANHEEDEAQQVDEKDYYRSKESFTRDVVRIELFCMAQRREIRESPDKGLLQRAKGLLFDGGCSYNEAFAVKCTLDIIGDAMRLGEKVAFLKHKDHERRNEMTNELIRLHKDGKVDEADLVLANFVLSEMRKGMLVGKLMELHHAPHGEHPPDGENHHHGEHDDSTLVDKDTHA